MPKSAPVTPTCANFSDENCDDLMDGILDQKGDVEDATCEPSDEAEVATSYLDSSVVSLIEGELDLQLVRIQKHCHKSGRVDVSKALSSVRKVIATRPDILQ